MPPSLAGLGMLLSVALLPSAARAPAAAWHCESWCNHYTCKNAACTDCRAEHGCGPGHELRPPTEVHVANGAPTSCASWCDEQTCTAAECSACDNPKCVHSRPGCEPWCMAPDHCGISDCANCNDPKCLMKTTTTTTRPDVAGCKAWCSEQTCDVVDCTSCQNPKCTTAVTGCARWCTDQTCDVADCVRCNNPKCTSTVTATPGCAAWCTEDTCKDSHCASCGGTLCPDPTSTAPDRVRACAKWCNAYTVRRGQLEYCLASYPRCRLC